MLNVKVDADDSEITFVLESMVDTISGKALRAGAKEFGKGMTKEIRANIEKGKYSTGTLKKNITYKVTHNKKTKMVFAIIGARRGVVKFFGKRKLVPSRYLHVYEKGHREGKIGKGPRKGQVIFPGGVQGRMPLKDAYKAHKRRLGEAAKQKTIQVMMAEAKKRQGKGKKVFK